MVLSLSFKALDSVLQILCISIYLGAILLSIILYIWTYITVKNRVFKVDTVSHVLDRTNTVMKENTRINENQAN